MTPPFMSLVLPAFIAGLLTFVAPCTFPLLPAYLSFLGGANISVAKNTKEEEELRKNVLKNALMYILGFSLVFIALGSLLSVVGVVLAPVRFWLTRIGGVLVIFFGLYLMGLWRLPLFARLARDERFIGKSFTPGNSTSAFLFGASFAFGWTPCIGPILGSILFLAGTRGTIAEGALLLVIFSLGLAIPFFVAALLLNTVMRVVKKIQPALGVLSVFGGIFLIIMGVYLATDQFVLFTSYFLRILEPLNYESILRHL